MQAMIGQRISAMAFLSVPVLALLALSPIRSTSQARELSSLLAASTGADVGVPSDGDNAVSEPITDLSDWSYTANPMSPVGKGSFHRRLLSNQPGPHPTPAGPNPRVPWITRPASTGFPPFAVVSSPVNQAAIVSSSVNQASLTPSANTVGNPQRFATSNPKTTPVTVTAPTLAAPQIFASMPPLVFQPVKSQWQDTATRRLRLGRSPTSN